MANGRSTPLAAIILTGGASSRMGTDKATQLWGDRRAVDWVASLARAVGSDPVVTAGGVDMGMPWAPDRHPRAGPVGGLMAGAALLAGSARRLLVLAVDAPTLRATDLSALLEATAPGASFRGFPLPMVLESGAIPPDVEDGWPLRRFVERAGLLQLGPPENAVVRLRGANTPDERASLM